MNNIPVEPATAQTDFEALRVRWEKAKANGTVEALVKELFDQGETVPPPANRVYESEEERAAYRWARENHSFTPADLHALLRVVFGDEKGIPMEQVLAELGTDLGDDQSAGGQDAPTK